MEVIEMDLMQAQIGELTTEVTAANNKIAKMPSIPTPEDTDAGKVIKVSETGEYELGTAGGNLNITMTFEDHTPVFDKTYNEIYNAITTGKAIFVNYTDLSVSHDQIVSTSFGENIIYMSGPITMSVGENSCDLSYAEYTITNEEVVTFTEIFSGTITTSE